MSSNEFFQTEIQIQTLIVTPLKNMGQLDFQNIEAVSQQLTAMIRQPALKHLVVDLSRTNNVGTCVLGCFVQLWKIVAQKQGKMVLCNVSDHEMDVIRITKLDNVWPVAGSRDEAVALVNS